MAIGRPREFDPDEALDRALDVFWKRGYEGATLPELTAAMGINRPSLYAAFGSKEELFRKAIDRYTARSAAHFREAMELPSARAAVERLLEGSIEMVTNPERPQGCLLVQGALACGEDADELRVALAARRGAGEEVMRERFEQAKKRGELPADSNPAALAKFYAAVIFGISVLASGGATAKELRTVVEVALRVWPTSNEPEA